MPWRPRVAKGRGLCRSPCSPMHFVAGHLAACGNAIQFSDRPQASPRPTASHAKRSLTARSAGERSVAVALVRCSTHRRVKPIVRVGVGRRQPSASCAMCSGGSSRSRAACPSPTALAESSLTGVPSSSPSPRAARERARERARAGGERSLSVVLPSVGGDGAPFGTRRARACVFGRNGAAARRHAPAAEPAICSRSHPGSRAGSGLFGRAFATNVWGCSLGVSTMRGRAGWLMLSR